MTIAGEIVIARRNTFFFTPPRCTKSSGVVMVPRRNFATGHGFSCGALPKVRPKPASGSSLTGGALPFVGIRR